MKNFRKIVSYMWRILRKYKIWLFSTFIIFGTAIVVGDAIVPVYVKKLTDSLQQLHSQEVSSTLFVLLALYLGMRLFFFVSMHILSWFQSRAARDLHDFSYEHFTKHSYHFYKDQFTGSLTSRFTRMGENMISILDNILFNFFTLFVSITGILVVLFIESVVIGFIFVGFLLVYFLLIFWMSKKLAPIYEERSRRKSDFNGTISDIITNIQTILFFANSYVDKKIFKDSNDSFFRLRYRAWKNSVNYQDTIGFLPSIFIIVVTFYAVHLVSIGEMTVGSVVMVFLLGNNFNGQVWRLGGSVKRFVSDISDTIEAIEIIEAPVSVTDVKKPEKVKIEKGLIVFKDVSFTYPKGDHVFDNLNFSVKAGESVGVVGKSGSGKTTITKLLLRLYDLDGGEILIDEQDISQIRQRNLRSKVAYIPQETILFHRTIYDNISYGNPDASKEEVIAAAKAAHVDEFVQNLKRGYSTKVGERGVKLSGGQRQRIGIARAMLKKDAPLLIMDEATSSLDSVSEGYIQESFKKLTKNRTTVVIAHRLSTIRDMDRIIVMDRGKIIENGSHDELISKKGSYYQLWNSQTDGFITE